MSDMQRDTVYELITKIPKFDIAKTVLTLRFNASITLDLVVRYENDYLVVRGREAGTNDDGRAFFVPYEEILFVKIDRTIKLSDLQKMYGETVTNEDESILDRAADSLIDGELNNAAKTALNDVSVMTPAPAMDPAGIAKQNLLARIRAARTAASSSVSS
jgi:hypothetical protein